MTMATKKVMRRATGFIRKVARAPPGSYPENFIALEWGSPLLLQIMSGEKTRLIEYLRTHGPVDSVTTLSEALGRSREAVSRDLQVLVNVGVVHAEQHGRHKSLRATDQPIVVW
jgi:predicted transcriptional regulator